MTTKTEPRDYVLFIHGVNTRQPTYADELKNLINRATPIKPIVIFWGDVSDDEERKLLEGYRKSPAWDKLWFSNLREREILSFAGDAALYLSRHIGAKVAERIAEQLAPLKECTIEDRIHVVSHSWGTVILFDLLFSSRWDQNESVMAIRDATYGVIGNDADPTRGIRLGSVSTMGSPIGLFSLMDVNPPLVDARNDPSEPVSTHDITPGLVKLLEYLYVALGERRLPWRNFLHPADPIAGTLSGILLEMVDPTGTYIEIQDVLVPLAKLFQNPIRPVFLDALSWLFRGGAVSVLDAGNAHGSYWTSPRVVEEITTLIKQARVLKKV
jgi:hypothetical protein